MNQPAEVIVLATGMRQVCAYFAVTKRAAQRDNATQNPCQEDVASTRATFCHESRGCKCAGPDHVGDNGYGRRGECQDSSIRHESDRREEMSELVLFGEEILLGIARGGNLNTDALYDFDACLLHGIHLSRVICHQAETLHSKVPQHFDTEGVVSKIGFESQVVIGLHGIHASVLEL